MEMIGDRILPASRAQVWAALNDPLVLLASIPGCKTLDVSGENAFRAAASVKIGPISANFTGDVALRDIDAPNGYRIEGSGQGGPAGFARGGARVDLSDVAGGTRLAFAVKAEVGGKIAQLGARLIDASAKQMADQFFDNFAAVLAIRVADSAGAAAALPAAADMNALSLIPREIGGFPIFAWVGAAIFLGFVAELLAGFF